MTKPNGHKKCVRGRRAIGCVLSIPRSVPLAAADHSGISRGAYRQTTPADATSAGGTFVSSVFRGASAKCSLVIDNGAHTRSNTIVSKESLRGTIWCRY